MKKRHAWLLPGSVMTMSPMRTTTSMKLPAAVAAALDSVAIACAPHRDLAVNPGKSLAISLADSNPVVWGGSVLAARAARRVAESIRRAIGRSAIAGDAEHLLPILQATRPRDVFADPFAAGANERRPMLVILDEPTSGLDPLMELVFQECIQELKAQGKSVFLSSHILSEVEKLCDRVSIIRQGRIIETGSLKELRHLTRTRVRVETAQSLPDLSSLPGLHDLEEFPGGASFQVDGDQLGPVLQYLSQYQIIALESAPPTLEELFMHHYKGAQ